MTREEIKGKIEEIERRRFFLAMKDMWNREDFERDRKWYNEVRELEKELEKAVD